MQSQWKYALCGLKSWLRAVSEDRTYSCLTRSMTSLSLVMTSASMFLTPVSTSPWLDSPVQCVNKQRHGNHQPIRCNRLLEI